MEVVTEPQVNTSFPDNLAPVWREKLAAEKDKPYFQELSRFLKQEHKNGETLYPAKKNILRALQALDLPEVKVVILGQDPYHGPGQAIGLSFAVPNELFPKPPSLQNIFKELVSDLGLELDKAKSDLSAWVEQGVFLLNTVLTVRAGQAFSHREKGWELFTDQVMRVLNEREQPVIFVLWGAAAIKKKNLINQKHHFILESVHPSPLSAHRGFFGSKPFSKINQILTEKLKQKPIDWAFVSSSI